MSHDTSSIMNDTGLRRREALRRLRAPKRVDDDLGWRPESFIESEPLNIGPWACRVCAWCAPVPVRLHVQRAATRTARRLVMLRRDWTSLGQPDLCMWCVERADVLAQGLRAPKPPTTP